MSSVPRRVTPFIGDLHVVKQNLLGYRTAELADIRTIMAGEHFERSTRSLRREESEIISRFERISEEESERKTNDRFELTNETQKMILSETSFGAGAEVSTSFGPISASAYFDFSQTNSQTETSVTSTQYAREVVERAVKRITEKSFDERSARLVEEFEERNLNRFANDDGENRSGLYFWIDQVSRLKVFNYGLRLFYRFYVPEPAAFWIMSQARQHQQDVPAEPEYPNHNGKKLTPAMINRGNWRGLVGRVEAGGVKPPPARFSYVTKHINREFRELTSHFVITPSQVDVPKGYRAHKIDGVSRFLWMNFRNGAEVRKSDLDIIVGKTYFSVETKNGADPVIVNYDPDAVAGDIGKVPIGAQFDALPDGDYGCYGVYAAVRIKCKLLAQEFRKWQMETYDAIMAAFHKQRSDYEETLAELETRGGFQITGQPPAINRQTERIELKKGCITTWTGHTFDHAPGILHNPEGAPPDNFPRVHLDNAEALAKDVELLEKGFDWDLMTYELLPYYWGRKEKWLETMALSDPDPLFREFLRAGGAMVTVPVNPDYARRILYFQLTGHTSPDDDVPMFHANNPSDTLSSNEESNRDPEFELYHSFIRELEAEEPYENLDGDVEIDADDPKAWTVSVPMPMTWLSNDVELPSPDET
ncbi:hypothetical protein [Pseudovibrio sp. Alg231-02]|uniref:hypothetical protein n=1 Tax=Pseudovibrio sp. Alg231-02 TaxID=1922223 RepID=UPI000D554EA8|nr:hypothetical protein [Pseudovibrio sp. Alg231-02]